MKYILSLLLLIISSGCFSQTKTTFYLDKNLTVVSKKEAEYRGTGEMMNGLFTLTCYEKNKKNVVFVLHYTDSTLREHQGSFRSYLDNGGIETEGMYNKNEKDGLWKVRRKDGLLSDSTLYDNGAQIINVGLNYYNDNHLENVNVDDVTKGQFYSTSYDKSGKVTEMDSVAEDYNNVYFMPETGPEFPGGSGAWTHFISKAVMNNINELGDNDYGTTLARFLIDTSGRISEARPLTMKGSKLSLILIDAITNGPAWIPAQQHGIKVKTYKIQPLTLANPK